MITNKQYDDLCALLDNYRDAVSALHTAASEDVLAAAYQFAEADREVHTALHALVDLEAIAKEAAEHSSWISWGGGGCPVDAFVNVDIKLRGGVVTKNYPAGCAIWRHEGQEWDIVAYRIVGPRTNTN